MGCNKYERAKLDLYTPVKVKTGKFLEIEDV